MAICTAVCMLPANLENFIHQLHGSDVNSLWILISGLHFTVGSYNSIGTTLLHHNGSAIVREFNFNVIRLTCHVLDPLHTPLFCHTQRCKLRDGSFHVKSTQKKNLTPTDLNKNWFLHSVS